MLVGDSKLLLRKLGPQGYPDVDKVIPDPGASKFEITFGVELLMDVFRAIKRFQGKGNDGKGRSS